MRPLTSERRLAVLAQLVSPVRDGLPPSKSPNSNQLASPAAAPRGFQEREAGIFMRLMINAVSLAFFLIVTVTYSPAQVPGNAPLDSTQPAVPSTFPNSSAGDLVPISKLEGVEFLNNSRSQIVLEKNGRKYLIDTDAKTIHEISLSTNGGITEDSKGGSEPSQTTKDAATPQKKEQEIYYTEDINLWNLPTAHHLEKKALLVDFAHRFSLEDGEVFRGEVLNKLFGLDGYSFSSFGLTYGITDTFFAGAYRVPSALGRIIQLYGGAQLSQEVKGHSFSSTFRVSVEGADHFSRNYVTSLELALAKSIGRRAQLYFVPTISFNNRPLIAPFGADVPEVDGETTTAIGAGISVDIRPTVAVIAEAIQRTSGLMGVHRPSFMFGIQKKVYRHSFTLGVTNSPGTTLSQRSATRASILLANLRPYGITDDTFSGLTIGFNLSRRLF